MLSSSSRVFVIGAAATALLGCGGGGDQGHTETVQVAANLAVCSGPFPQLCYLKRPTGSPTWTLQYEGIAGFNYDWGREYTLRVNVKSGNAGGVQDVSSTSYELLGVESSVALPRTTLYQISVSTPQSFLSKGSDGIWRLLGRLAIGCQPAVCFDLEMLVAGQTTLLLTFDHTNSPSGPLNLLAAAAGQ